MKKRVALLGSTGSIGRQSLEVIRQQNDEVALLCAGQNTDLLLEQVREFLPPIVAVATKEAATKIEAELAALPFPPKLLFGKDAAREAVLLCEADVVLNAIVGIAGLDATLAALGRGMDVALANKESLVTGGELVVQESKAKGGKLLPVDSEHSAIFQCLQDEHSAKELKRIILTASGGPFYKKTTQDLAKVKVQDALNHPNWAMGNKITIDSATLMNKGLEFIEAMWLFDLRAEQVEIVVQRQSIIHSMVEFSDNSVLAQLGVPDMRLPIQYALTYPARVPGTAPQLDFQALTRLDFGMADEETFRCLAACKKAAKKGGLAACAANGANEEAVALFLKDEISFLDIGRLVEGCVDSDSFAGAYDLKDVYACDALARQYVQANKKRTLN